MPPLTPRDQVMQSRIRDMLIQIQDAKLGRALTQAVSQALCQDECEVRITFDTQRELDVAGERLLQTARLELMPGVGNFLFLTEHCTKTQIELLNGSCILLSLKDPPK